MDYNDEKFAYQVDIQKVCTKHNVGRHDLIIIATFIAREEMLTPHEALKKLLLIEDLDVYYNQIKEKRISKEFNRRLRGSSGVS